MKAKDIAVGKFFTMKVSGNIVPVRVDSIHEREGTRYGRGGTTYGCTNLKTGRSCSARSASKFRMPLNKCKNCDKLPMFGCECRASERAMAAANKPDPMKLTPDEKLGNQASVEKIGEVLEKPLTAKEVQAMFDAKDRAAEKTS